jgi:hypothetical protein
MEARGWVSVACEHQFLVTLLVIVLNDNIIENNKISNRQIFALKKSLFK